MNPTPFLEASAVIQIHAYFAVFALALGAFILLARKGTPRHKLLGRIWGLAMLITAISSFWINQIRLVGPFSPIHLLSVYAVYAVFEAVFAARRGDIKSHKKTMKALFVYGLILPGLLTFLPGRLLNQVFIEPLIERDFVSGNELSTLDQIILNSPIWVWPLMVALIIIGMLHTRPYSIGRNRIFIFPITFSITAGIAAFTASNILAVVLGTLAAAWVFIPIGKKLAARAVSHVSENQTLRINGEWLTMALFATIFATRFLGGFVNGVAPELASHWLFDLLLSIPSGAVVGIALGRSLLYRQEFTKGARDIGRTVSAA